MKINKVLCYALGVATVINFGLVVYMANIVKDARDNVGEYLQNPVSVSVGEVLRNTAITTVTGGTKTGILLGDLKATKSGEIIIGEIGWNTIDAINFSYASSSTITVTGFDATEVFQIGDKIRLTQTTDKYFYVIKVASGLLTLNAGSDYTVANAAITGLAFSGDVAPSGFPAVFEYTPTITQTGSSSFTTVTNDASFKMDGSFITLFYDGSYTWSVGDGPVTFKITLPFATDRTINATTEQWGVTRGGAGAFATVVYLSSNTQLEYLLPAFASSNGLASATYLYNYKPV